MKLAAPVIPEREEFTKGVWTLLADLIKIRLTALVLITTTVGFYAGWSGPVDFLLLAHTVLGTALVASGAAALNQLLERAPDALMRRTENRPLPSGRVQPDTVLLFGGICAAAGLIYLAIAVNLLTSVLGVLTLLSYLFVYTPLKRITSLNTVIGAIPGALPPLMGWTAAHGEVSLAGWSLFLILFFWQLPHFLAIAWIYREDYARGGFAMLPVLDPTGERTGRQAVSHTLGLLPVSLAPSILGLAGKAYFFGALALGLGFLWFVIQFSRRLSISSARQLFFASIIYLPLLMILLVLDKLK